MIEIGLNKKLDYEVYLDFKDFSVASADFGGKIKADHPTINPENYIKYIDDFYIANEKEISDKLVQINKILGDKQAEFWQNVKNIFGDDLSEKTFKGFISIFNCNPRFTDTETFQIYYKKDLLQMLEVAFHESLHFAFFEYCDKNLPESTKGLSKNSGPLWELSEILNVIILNKPEFSRLTEREEKLFYPSLQDKLVKIKVIWNKTFPDMKGFVEESLKNI